MADVRYQKEKRMSHANGQCRFDDGLILHFEYNGTGDWCLRRLGSIEEIRDGWRTEANEVAECICGHDEPVTLANDYGGGAHFRGRACRHCRAITFDPLAPWNDDQTFEEPDNGLPDWFLK